MSSADPTVTTPSICKAVVPAAGLGMRLRPLTRAFPKEMLPLGREPVLAYVATELLAAGITQALFVVSERKPQIRSYFGDLYRSEDETLPPLQCDYVVQKEQRGSGDAVLCAEAWTGDQPFVVAFGDCLIEASPSGAALRRLIAAYQGQNASAALLVEAVAREKVSRYGVVAPAYPINPEQIDPFALSGIIEKPTMEAAPSNLVVAARWVLGPAVFPALRRATLDERRELSIPDGVQIMLQDGEPVWAMPLRAGEARRDIGNLESFFAQFIRAALRDPDYGPSARRVAAEELSRNPER